MCIIGVSGKWGLGAALLFLTVLGPALRALHMLGKHSTVAKLVNSRFSEGLCLKTQGGERLEKTACASNWPSGHSHMDTCHIDTNTYN